MTIRVQMVIGGNEYSEWFDNVESAIAWMEDTEANNGEEDED